MTDLATVGRCTGETEATRGHDLGGTRSARRRTNRRTPGTQSYQTPWRIS